MLKSPQEKPKQYQRPQPATRLSKPERKALLEAYYLECRHIAENELDALNRKLPREIFAEVLDAVGGILLQQAASLAVAQGPVRTFLDANPLPISLRGKLPEEFRAFCLLLNALKQWVAAEQAASDRYLLGGEARGECRAAATTCVVSGAPLAGASIELHHPVRDGRPPIPLTKEGHTSLEGQLQSQEEG